MSQNMKILGVLMQGKSITSFEAFKDFHITRLSGRIFDIRQMGFDVKDIWETSENDPNVRYVRYVINNTKKAKKLYDKIRKQGTGNKK